MSLRTNHTAGNKLNNAACQAGAAKPARAPRPATATIGGSPKEALQYCAWLRAEKLESLFPQIYANVDSTKVVSLDSYEHYCGDRQTFKKRLGKISTNDKACVRMRYVFNEVAKMTIPKGTSLTNIVPKLIAKAARLTP